MTTPKFLISIGWDAKFDCLTRRGTIVSTHQVSPHCQCQYLWTRVLVSWPRVVFMSTPVEDLDSLHAGFLKLRLHQQVNKMLSFVVEYH